jgi:acyl carrier protein
MGPVNEWLVLEQHLLGDPAIKQCKVIAVDPTVTDTWTVVVAFHDAKDGVANIPRMHQAYKRLCTRMTAQRDRGLPRRWLSLDDIPTYSSGNVNIEALCSQVIALHAAVTHPCVEVLRTVVANTLELPLVEVRPSSSFVGLGGDSMTAIEVMANCLEEDMTLKVSDIIACTSLLELAALATFEDIGVASTIMGRPLEHMDLEPEVVDYWGSTEDWCTGSIISYSSTVHFEGQRPGGASSGVSLVDICVAAIVDSFQRTFLERFLPLALAVATGTQALVVRSLELSVSEDEQPLYTLRRVKDWMKNAEPLEGTDSSTRFVELLVHVVEGAAERAQVQTAREWCSSAGVKPMFIVFVRLGQGGAVFDYQYHSGLVDPPGILEWADRCREVLRGSPFGTKGPLFSLTDFPQVPLSYQDLDAFVAAVSQLRQFDVEHVYRCSPVQEGILSAQIRSEDAYRIELTIEWVGGTQLADGALEAAWLALVTRHAALRTVFLPAARHNARFDQAVLRRVEVNILRLEAVKDRFAAIRALQALAPMTFVYNRPPHRLAIVETRDGGVFCRLEMSHAIVDGLSAGLLLREWERALSGKRSDVPIAPFSNLISFLQDQQAEAPLDYWTRYLDGVQPSLFPIMVDEVPSLSTVESVTVEFDAPQLRDFCRARSVTISTLMQAAWGLVLRGYTQSDDVSFGYLTSGRDAPGFYMKGMIGCLVNLVICRIQFAELGSLAELLDRVQRDRGPGIVNQYVSLAALQNEVLQEGAVLFNTLLSVMQEQGSDTNDAIQVVDEVASTEVSNFFHSCRAVTPGDLSSAAR